MVLRITRGRIDPARSAEAQRIMDEQVLPAMRQLPGFQGHQGGINRGTGQSVSITTWDTEEQAMALRDKIAAKAEALFALGLVIESSDTYELVPQAAPPGAFILPS
jgi:hypothetical protein